MSSKIEQSLENQINCAKLSPEQRTAALRQLISAGGVERGKLMPNQINNHVHSIYSFSPYTPSQVVLEAYRVGLAAVGIIDHDSIAAAAEARQAGKLLGLPVTAGVELRTFTYHPRFREKKFNSPDAPGLVYMVMHGVPECQVEPLQAALARIRQQRNLRNRAQLQRLNAILTPAGVAAIDFDRDVLPLSQAHAGGSVTERHLLLALAHSLARECGQGAQLLKKLAQAFGMQVSGKIRSLLEDESNPYYNYDLLGLLKSEFLPRFFIVPSGDECIDLLDCIKLCQRFNITVTYPYLGDVTESPTGDKKAEHFEDEILDDWLLYLRDLEVMAVSYMPPRNSKKQLQRIQKLCRQYGFMEISGVDINSPRQQFITPELEDPDCLPLRANSWALLAHEHLVSSSPELGLFYPGGARARQSWQGKLEHYADLGQQVLQLSSEQLQQKAHCCIKEEEARGQR